MAGHLQNRQLPTAEHVSAAQHVLALRPSAFHGVLELYSRICTSAHICEAFSSLICRTACACKAVEARRSTRGLCFL